MKDDIRENIFKACAVLIVVTIIAGGLVTAWPAYQRRAALKQQDAQLSECIEKKRHEIAELVECQRRFKTDADFVESIARQNRRVFPGELVFIFTD